MTTSAEGTGKRTTAGTPARWQHTPPAYMRNGADVKTRGGAVTQAPTTKHVLRDQAERGSHTLWGHAANEKSDDIRR